MNEDLRIKTEESYSIAEQRAACYYQSLHKQVKEGSHIPVLIDNIQLWKKKHVHHRPIFSFLINKKRNPDSKDYYRYLQWLENTGKLDNYLDRSISYIYLRDLGKSLDDLETQARIVKVVGTLKQHLISAVDEREIFSMAGLYRWAEKEGVEDTLIWLINKMKIVSSHIPDAMDAEQAQRKLIKIIAGVIMHVIEEMGEEVTSEERTMKLDEAMRLGYSYGLTYPFIDDLQDSNILSEEEKIQFSDLIRTTLLTQSVPEINKWSGKNIDLITYVHAELREAFEYIKKKLRSEVSVKFFDQSYVFFHSQEVDRLKDLSYDNYTNEELYVPVILKAAFSRLIVRSVISADEDEGFDNRTFYYGIYNQLADDFTDMFDDLNAGSVTPYTYYMKYRDQRSDLINPYELYWTVISNLIQNVYHSDSKACEVILDRAINSLKRCKERLGIEKYKEVMDIFASGNPAFNRIIQQMVKKAEDVDFFDKLLRDHILSLLRKERKERRERPLLFNANF